MRNPDTSKYNGIPPMKESLLIWIQFIHPNFQAYTWDNEILVGGLNPSEEYESQLGWLFPIYGKIENVPNHQPGFVFPVFKWLMLPPFAVAVVGSSSLKSSSSMASSRSATSATLLSPSPQGTIVL